MRQGINTPDCWARVPFRQDCIVPRTKLEIKYTVGNKISPPGGKQELGVKISNGVDRKGEGERDWRIGDLCVQATLSTVGLRPTVLLGATKNFNFF